MEKSIVTTKRLLEEPFASVICYPVASKSTLKKRVLELEKNGITSIEFIGEIQIGNVHVLGKGCVGIVTVAYRRREKIALKIRRTDADRASMLQEMELLKKANTLGVGPKLSAASKNFLMMQFADGELLPEWLKTKRSKPRIQKVLGNILEQCWILDQAGLDHGELSHAPKHVIITSKDKPVIVDFESASIKRRPANVTAICQFLFISGLSDILVTKLGRVKKSALIEVLRIYKKEMSRENLLRVLKSCALT